ncbi:MAG TPA: aldose 1-epimerase family protein [Armatimonadota bacterium]|jgi:hypothetical protein
MPSPNRPTRADIERRVGSMDQMAGIRPYSVEDGPGRGARALHVHTGSGLEFAALPDRALDILDFRYNGRSLCWHSGVGPASPDRFDPHGKGWLRSFFGGMLTTCGLSNAGAPSEDGGEAFGLHGRISNASASNVRWGAEWAGDDYALWISGETREASALGRRLVLRRHISTAFGSNTVVIEDTVENEGFSEEPFMLLYHVNAGYPLLDEGAIVRIDSEFEGYDEHARAGVAAWNQVEPPESGIPEKVFIHDVRPDADGFAKAELYNPALNLGFRVRWRKAELPNLWQWKMLGDRDYVMGLEPGNCGPGGRAAARVANATGILPPRGFVCHRVELEAFEE